MTTKKGPLPAARSAGVSTEATALQGASLSNYQLTTADKCRQAGFIEALLIRYGAHGAANAIQTERLVEISGLGDKRSLQSHIEQERASGGLILSKCAHGGGYYLPANRAELVAFERTLRRRALGTLRSLRTTRQALKIMEGQEVLSRAETQGSEKL